MMHAVQAASGADKRSTLDPCTNCGNSLRGANNFCSECGTAAKRHRVLSVTAGMRRETAHKREADLREEHAPPRLDKSNAELGKLLQWLREEGVQHPTIYSPDAEDVFSFLAVRSLEGRTIVHVGDCRFWGLKSNAHCKCPSNMSYGSVRSLRFSLQAAFRDAGRVGPFDPRTGAGNPCIHARTDQLLEMIRKQQSAAGVTQSQAALVDESIFNKMMDHMQTGWKAAVQAKQLLRAAEFARDACFIALLWESGMRAGEALRVNASQVTRFSSTDTAGVYIAVGEAKAHSGFRITTTSSRRADRSVPRRAFYSCLKYWEHAVHSLDLELRGPLFMALSAQPDGTVLGKGRVQWKEMDKRFRNMMDVAGFSDEVLRLVTLHSFHGSRASREARAGIPMADTIANMRWTKEMYQYYTHGREPLVLEGIQKTGHKHKPAGRSYDD